MSAKRKIHITQKRQLRRLDRPVTYSAEKLLVEPIRRTQLVEQLATITNLDTKQTRLITKEHNDD